MNDPTEPAESSGVPIPFEDDHYALIKNATPRWLTNASAASRNALKALPGDALNWMNTASVEQHLRQKQLNADHWDAYNRAETPLSQIESPDAFAERLLKPELKALGLDIDPRTTCLRLYVPHNLPLLHLPSGAARIWSISMVDAALHNFEPSETEGDAFEADSCYTTSPDARGHFSVLRDIVKKLSIQSFVRLCRTLDIGRQYKAYLEDNLGISNPVVAAVLPPLVQKSQQAAFLSALHMSQLKGDISADVHSLLLAFASGDASGDASPTHNNRSWYSYDLDMLSCPLSGVVIFAPELNSNRTAQNVVAYIPDDPEHPVKAYVSGADLVKDLSEKLRDSAYQTFFSRFIDHADHATFFGTLNQRLSQLTWHPYIGNDAEPSWRDERRENPRLELTPYKVKGELWLHLYRVKLDKILNDGRSIAISTADANRNARWKRWDAMLNIAKGILAAAAFILAPLIPPLGTLMLGYTAYQLLEETFEGILDWAEGQATEAWEHLLGVIENLIQLGAFAVGAGPAEQLLKETLPATTRDFIKALQPVRRQDNQIRLWKPDLEPYERPMHLPETARADKQGLYHHQQQTILRQAGKHYAVEPDTDSSAYRIHHPRHAGAYRPYVRGNRQGLWVHETENPQTWSGSVLMRRLGPHMERFSDIELERIRLASGTDEAVLRRLYINHETPPALLSDCLERFRTYADAEQIVLQWYSGLLTDESAGLERHWFTRLPEWPAECAIEVFSEPDLSGQSRKYGNRDASAANTFKISRSAQRDGELAGTLVDGLGDQRLRALFGGTLPDSRVARIEALRKKLYEFARGHQRDLFDSLYRQRSSPPDSAVQMLQRDFSHLPTIMAQELTSRATADELTQLTQRARVPLRLATQARWCQRETRLARAYEGLYLSRIADLDTDRLMLHSMATMADEAVLPGIELREDHLNGRLLDRAGRTDEVVTLVKQSSGRYLRYGPSGKALPDADTLLKALHATLPVAEQVRLAVPTAEALGERFQKQPLPRQALSRALGLQQPHRRFQPPVRLADGRFGYPLSPLRWFARRSLEGRIRRLYPDLPEASVSEFAGSPNVEIVVRNLEREFSDLGNTLAVWTRLPSAIGESQAREFVASTLVECWRKPEPVLVNDEFHLPVRATLDFSERPLGSLLRDFPPLKARFNHILALRLSGAELEALPVNFLECFPRLHKLNLSRNSLIRVPEAIYGMKSLRTLNLGSNQIELTPIDVARLRASRELRWLNLSYNPLQIPPDLSQMPRLIGLQLDSTGLQQWPAGVFAHPRPRDFSLHLAANPIEIPDVAPGSDRANIIARAQLSPRRLTQTDRNRVRLYREALGVDTERAAPPRRIDEAGFWLENVDDSTKEENKNIWAALEDEDGSTPLFNELLKLTESADYSPRFRADLTNKVWRMLTAASENTALREKLFQMASAPTTCTDAGTQVFNSMGVEVMLHEYLALPDAAQAEIKLIQLARGKSRLDHLSRIARGVIADRLAAGEQFARLDNQGDITGSIYEVETHLAYTVALAERLDLPWQARSMQFQPLANVTNAMVESAYRRVLALEEGELLRESILEHPFWTDFLTRQYPKTFQPSELKAEALIDLQAARARWVNAKDLSKPEKKRLRATLKDLGGQLGKSEREVFSDTEMSEQEYDQDYARILDERSARIRGRTEQAMTKAGIFPTAPQRPANT